ncbi:MAG: YicC family protein [Spirochaetaceae bacterium]|nr:YicC family protein [Spirochaetaceae bacterium]MCF7947094.1 YicC family protein [Spirochaetia bacterium]MCF7950095.1 YicC family protein [Spirochaetaceae bacterium]
MISMTGYSYREYQDERVNLALELKSYNNRYLDIVINAPPFLSPLEPALRNYLKSRIVRGRVEISLRVKELEEDLEVYIDQSAAKEYAAALRRLAETVGLQEEPRLSHFLRLEGVIKPVKNRDLEWFEKLVLQELEAAASEFVRSRQREGESTDADIRALMQSLEASLATIEAHSVKLEEYIQNQLTERFKELVGENYDENRILSETAVMLMKYSVGEETVRMRSHLDQFMNYMQESGGVGKKLDFICQEMHREINTIGSKSNIIAINQAVVEAKDALEKIREQLRNVE